MDMMFLVLLKSGLRRSETENFAPQVRKDVILGRDRPSVNVDVAGIGRDAIGNRAHDRLVLDTARQPSRRLDQATVSQSL